MHLTLADFSIQVPLRVAWGEMDAFQHVNNCSYFRYFENARIIYLESLEVLNQHPQPILASASCKFIRPIFYPENITVCARATGLFKHGFNLEYGIFSEKACHAIGDSVIVCYDKEKKEKTVLPDFWREKIIKIDKHLNES